MTPLAYPERKSQLELKDSRGLQLAIREEGSPASDNQG